MRIVLILVVGACLFSCARSLASTIWPPSSSDATTEALNSAAHANEAEEESDWEESEAPW